MANPYTGSDSGKFQPTMTEMGGRYRSGLGAPIRAGQPGYFGPLGQFGGISSFPLRRYDTGLGHMSQAAQLSHFILNGGGMY